MSQSDHNKRICIITKGGGLDLSQSCIGQGSWSGHCQLVCINSRQNLDFVSTPPYSPKSLGRENCWDLTFLVSLDSLSWSWLRVSKFYHLSWLRFVNLLRFFSLKFHKKSQKCRDILINLDKTQ